MKRAFKIFKEGVTTKGPVWILFKENAVFDIQAKVKFYEWLGYTVTNVQPI